MSAEGDFGVSTITTMWSERDMLTEAEALGHVGAWAWWITTRELWWSDETFRICGHTPGDFTPTYEGFFASVHPDDRAEVERRVKEAVDGTSQFDVAHRMVYPSGEVRHVIEHGKVLREPDGTPVRMLGFIQDVTEEVTLREALAESRERYRLLAENAWDVIWSMELDGSISYVSPAVERVRGLTPEEARAQTPDEINPPESAARVQEYFGQVLEAINSQSEPPQFHGELDYYRKDGSIMSGELEVIPQLDADGRVLRLLGVTRDISERHAYEAKLHELAVTDSLTRVWNRRHAETLTAAAMDDSRRYGIPMSLLMLDLDHFKDVNDFHGHHKGDLVLVEFCRRLAEPLRSSDVLARWGGEEFIILMRHCPVADAVPAAERFRRLIGDTPFDEVGTVTVSIGVAGLQPEDDIITWLRRADRALYDAKDKGRNTVCVST